MKRNLLLTAIMFCGSVFLQAAVTVPEIFSDGAVLAKRSDVPVFGRGTPGEKVTVKFDRQTMETVVGTDGNWEVILNLQDSPAGPFELHINDKVIKDVAVGEVFLASGQSNMEYPLLRVEGFAEACRLPENRNIRQFKVRNRYAFEPVAEVYGKWVCANSRTLSGFSATGYFFAKKLQDTLNVPVGIVNSSWGGTPLEGWMSKESAAPFDETVKLGKARLAALNSYPERFKKFLRDTAAWEQKYGRGDIPVKLPAPEVQWQPHTGDVSGGGICWLRNKIRISAHDARNGFKIYFGRIYAPIRVFIDGREIMSGDAGKAWSNAPFGIWCKAGAVTAGEHELLVRYHISHDRMHMPQPFRFGDCSIDGKGWEIWREKTFPECAGEMLKNRPVPLGNAPVPAGQWYCLYNAMIHPLIPYRFSGVIWYQGEANAGRYRNYGNIFAAMIMDWRQKFRDENLPFYFCQLASFQSPAAVPGNCGNWPYLRQEQSRVLKLARTGMVVLTDAGEIGDVHPRNKKTPGERLAALALKHIYGQDIPAESPAAVSAVRRGGQVTVTFSHTDGGLTAAAFPAKLPLKTGNRTFTDLIRRSPEAQLEGFALCGADGKWFWADRAQIAGETVVVSSGNVAEPVKIRYNWSHFPIGNLFSKAGFPAAPFELKVK